MEMWKYATELKLSVPDARSHVHSPSSSARIMGAEVSINSKGLRDREFAYVKTPGIERILVIGDSVTFGFGVGQDETFPKLLEKMLNARSPGSSEVLNAGIGNYNTRQEAEAYRRELYRYDPDKIVLAFYVNDPEPTQKYVENFFSKRSEAYAFFMSAYRKLAANIDPSLTYGEYYANLYSGDSWKRFESEVSQLPKTLPVSKTCVLLIPESHSTDPYAFSKEYARVSEVFRKA